MVRPVSTVYRIRTKWNPKDLCAAFLDVTDVRAGRKIQGVASVRGYLGSYHPAGLRISFLGEMYRMVMGVEEIPRQAKTPEDARYHVGEQSVPSLKWAYRGMDSSARCG